ncbi:FAD-dependent monooxygenase [Haloechinothrix halophila]|uniref:2-polyprenyl-6-methoxyphenol hydroxylase-like oxidoreductase n=1 Tax=Haloechinothrix halophila YIM 93223 TaxID=592678 RepID=W9DSG2_9PSEU|nr:FAD-dependent monooxygenase [Haloechinothrix halophila]ETA66602.1 2-polyprenyl-6-methoxyphenol hydroxylase-like oxidoreductase [Haloechinothrix halophila YIM 93223]
MTDAPLLIAGAGIGGLTLATALRRSGGQALVLEERDELSEVGAGITLWPNALAALDDIGLGDAVRDAGCALSSAGIKRADGRWLRRLSPTAIDPALGEPVVAIHRGTLLTILAEGAGTDIVRTSAPVRDVRQHPDGVTITLAGGERITGCGLVGADGIRSAVAAHLDPDLRWRYSGYTAWRAVANVGLDVEPAETWGPDGEFGYVPLGTNRTYWFATQVAPEGQTSDDELGYLADRLAGWHDPIAALLAATAPNAVLRHDIHDRDVPRRWASGGIALIGDAAHPMRPHLGQGGCQAVIDAVVLATLINSHVDLPTAFARFAAVRRRRVGRIVRQSALTGAVIHARGPLGAAARVFAQHLPQRLLLRQLATVAGASAYRRPTA